MNDENQEEVGRQQRFKLERPIEKDLVDDEGRPYQVIPLSMLAGGELKPTRVYTDPVKHVHTTSSPSPRGWYKDKTYDPPTKRPRPCYSESLLTTPFGGFCPVGCRFCYVTHGTRGYRATGIATVNPDYPDKFKAQLAKLNVASAAYISSFTEPFQHLEDEYHIVQRLTNVLEDAGLPVFFLSRLIPPEWAVEALHANPYSYMQWSINTPNEKHRRLMSPGTAKLDDLFESMDVVACDGIYISIQCNPILAGITTLEELLELVDMVAESGGHHIIFKFVEQVYSNRTLLLERLTKARLPGVDMLDKYLSQTIGGVYTIDQGLRVEWLTELLKRTRSVGITMSTCYEYYDNGHAGANLAPWYATADQCHGRGVPVHHRPEEGYKFVPLAGCYRKGCLYCEDFGTAICENNVLLGAKALQYKDMRDITLRGVYENDWDEPESCARPDEVWESVHGNPDLATDAELWGLPALADVLDGGAPAAESFIAERK